MQTESRIVPIFCCIHFTLYLYKPSGTCCREASPQHEAATTMLHGRDGVFVEMCSIWCPPNIASSLIAKKLHLVSSDQRTFFQLTVAFPTCLWMNSNGDLMSFLQQWFMLCHSPIKLSLLKNPGNSCMQSLFQLSC